MIWRSVRKDGTQHAWVGLHFTRDAFQPLCGRFSVRDRTELLKSPGQKCRTCEKAVTTWGYYEEEA